VLSPLGKPYDNYRTVAVFVFQATVVHDMAAIDPKSVSAANRMTIADEAMVQFRKNVYDPLKSLAALREAGKHPWHRRMKLHDIGVAVA